MCYELHALRKTVYASFITDPINISLVRRTSLHILFRISNKSSIHTWILKVCTAQIHYKHDRLTLTCLLIANLPAPPLEIFFFCICLLAVRIWFFFSVRFSSPYKDLSKQMILFQSGYKNPDNIRVISRTLRGGMAALSFLNVWMPT